jgi:hypothetical protein
MLLDLAIGTGGRFMQLVSFFGGRFQLRLPLGRRLRLLFLDL